MIPKNSLGEKGEKRAGNYLIKKNIAALIEDVDDFEFAMGWERKAKQATVQKQLFLDFKTIEEETLGKLDRLVSSKVFPNRSKAIQEAIQEKLTRVNKSRLARECAKLDPAVEKAIAEEGFSQEIDQWPEY